MEKAKRPPIAGILLAAALLVNGLVSAQVRSGLLPPDISGAWQRITDEKDSVGQPPLGDYTGIAFNEAGRLRAETTPESIWGTPEYQCRPHSAPHQWRGVGGVHILKEQDSVTRDVNVYHLQFMRSLDRPIFMDGRPHPPAYAPHTWSGFSTGEWVGNTLKVTTTHLKEGYLRRGGPQTTDVYAMTEYITRHDDTLTVVTVIDDPIYLDEPYIHSTTYTFDPTYRVSTEICNGPAVAENGGTDRHFVPHFLPGTNTDMLTEWIVKGDPRSPVGPENWVPLAAARGGLNTIYPEYRLTLNGKVSADTLKVPSSRSVVNPAKMIADQSPRDGEVHLLPVQGNIYMLVADGTNLTVSVGTDGVVLVNTGPRQMSDKVLAAINELSKQVAARPQPNTCFGADCAGAWGWSSPFMNTVITSPGPTRPIKFIINTSAAPEHTGGNEKLVPLGTGLLGNELSGIAGTVEGAPVIAHENVLNRMSAPAGKEAPTPAVAWPTMAYYDEFSKLPQYFNGEPVIVYYEPAANTDGDSIVHFRRSEVISAGDIFSTISYPVIDIAKGGSVQGVIRGLNHILDLAVAQYRSQGGTWIIPSHGRLSDTADIASYRNMVVIIRDRVQDMIDKGMTLQQIQAARPSLDFDGRYGSTTGTWTTNMFIEAVYQSLQTKK
jgi:cyclase